MIRWLKYITTLCLVILLPAKAQPGSLGTEKTPPIKVINDPIEPVNRVFYGFNNVLFGLVINPFVKGYRTVMPDPVRKSINKAGVNIEYPVRFINCLLLGKFKGAGVETGRFAVNSTVGLLGFFDPATGWGMKKYNEDFGKTLAHYGAGWGFYLVLPLLGTSSFRDTLGGQVDSLANPAGWIYLDYLFDFNNLTFTLPLFEQTDALSLDPYATERDLWALSRKSQVQGFTENQYSSETRGHLTGIADLGEERLHPRDPKFYQKAREREVPIHATGKKMPYSFWLQRGAAPLVIVLPEAGAHRLADSSLSVCEMAWKKGFSAVALSSPLNWEFIETAGTTAVAGYPPADARDVDEALKAVYQDLMQRYPGRISSVSLLGTDLGGVHALTIADLDRKQPGGVPFRRIVAINPPVDPFFAMQKFEEYYRAPLAWSPAQRHGKMERALVKAVGLAGKNDDPRSSLDPAEARYLIGWTYHRMLRDLIYASQKKQNLGIVPAHFGSWKRQPTYDALDKYSCTDYIRLFLIPYYQKQGGRNRTPEDLIAGANLRAIEPAMASDPRLRVFTNRDDFTLSPSDLEWQEKTLGERLVVFPNGGHLGNLHLDAMQDRIMATLDDIKHP